MYSWDLLSPCVEWIHLDSDIVLKKKQMKSKEHLPPLAIVEEENSKESSGQSRKSGEMFLSSQQQVNTN